MMMIDQQYAQVALQWQSLLGLWVSKGTNSEVNYSAATATVTYHRCCSCSQRVA
jgi:hypothetical protein